MSSQLLIADPNEARAKRLLEACTEQGWAAALAETGAGALEQALTELPDMLVLIEELPLIDGPRLAGILRANPRTRELRILLLGRDSPGVRTAGLFDDVLPLDATEGEVVRRVEMLLAQRARIEAVDRETAADNEVSGQLSQIPLTDLLQVFHMNARTGELLLQRNEPGSRRLQGSILLREGQVVQAHAGGPVEGEKAFYRLLTWRDGSFQFAPSPVHQPAKIQSHTRSLLLEGMRQLDEWERAADRLPPPTARVALATPERELPNAVHPVTQEVLVLIELYDRVSDIVDHCTFSDYQALRTLQALLDRGWVRRKREAERNESSAQGSLFDEPQIHRFRDWLEARRTPESITVPAKLLLASPEQSTTQDFLRLLEALPQFELARGIDPSRLQADDLVDLGHLAVGEGLGIDWIHLPSGPAAQAQWPVALHDALGVLMLLATPLERAQEALRPLQERLASFPNTRCFYVFVLAKGERMQPEQLQQRVDLLDSGSLFLLPLESGRDPVSLLRGTFSRLLP